MREDVLQKVVVRLYRSILGRGAGENEISDRIRRSKAADNEIDFILSMVDELLGSEEFARRYGHNKSFQTVTDSDIFYAFKFLLGRHPENPNIYEGNRKKSSTAVLIEEIVASDEFKSNKILKKLISIRRKPKGFDEFQAISSRNKKNALVISGCQGRMIADLLQSGAGFGFVESIYMNPEQQTKFVATKGQDYENLLAQVDIIYTQKQPVYDMLQEDRSLRQKTRLIPLVEYAGLQPDQCNLIDTRSGTPIIGPMGEYQSTILAAAFFAGLDAKTAATTLNSKVYSKFGFDEISAASKARFLLQEENTGHPLQQMFEHWEATGKWMRTINHPKKFVLKEIVNFVLLQDGITPSPDFDEFVIDDLADNADWPKYGGPGHDESNTETLKFKRPKAFSPIANSAEFINLQEYTDMFYRSMEGYSLDHVSCYQLGRKIELEQYIDYMRQEFIHPN
ncbi:WcbI family polysaccharide biosynthesis putative acetyltransferase [Pseudomonas asiatica]|uniref:WcbI family polysaccharide biosynthesis putative acetyltransferase n=1 Tax=Pseudomonas asiatica TaxID=2219225 RepID=UPI0018A8C3E6|nr:WcbI family polysaccharide biosynthesis putative acetyltransferase [Pseudomonas asiatica]MBF8802203.1 hypothetical protein [Pseudomonas asiatica]